VFGAHITAAYWFTSSTSFANPAVTLAGAATETFADIRPADAPAFIAVQLGGTLAAALCVRRLLPTNQVKGTPAAGGEDSGRVV
jgi:glycerol uptake facilitator-like aquaporin